MKFKTQQKVSKRTAVPSVGRTGGGKRHKVSLLRFRE
jgi:hypothetical protein